jgi:hypothetical protein
VAADKLELVRKLIEEVIPFNRVLGIRLDSAADGKAEARFDF